MANYTISSTSQKLVDELREKYGVVFRADESTKGSYYFYGTKEQYPCSATFSSWRNVRQYLKALNGL